LNQLFKRTWRPDVVPARQGFVGEVFFLAAKEAKTVSFE